MHHKRKRTKNQRSGCLFCKPNKMNGWKETEIGHYGFGKLKKLIHAKEDMKNFQ